MFKKAIALIFFLSCSHTIYGNDKNIDVRVLLGFSKVYKIGTKGTYSVVINNKKASVQGNITLSFHKQGILFNNKLFKTSRVDILNLKGFMVNGKPYRGSFTVHREKNTLSFINRVDLELYLASVVPSEVYVSWNSDTLKSQAVIARTYALYEIQRSRKNKNKKFDVYADTRSQVYNGVKAEHPKTTKYVFLTKGQILTYKGKLIKSYFSSSIGGISAAGYEIGDNKPYLKPVKSYHSKKNPNNHWSIRIPLAKIQQTYKTSQIKNMGVASRTSSGRINTIKIKDSRGKVTTVRGDHFRAKIGYGKMKSTLASLDLSKSGNLIIKGKGFGHGVGLGQWEAQELAQRGASYQQILRHFYTGTRLVKIY